MCSRQLIDNANLIYKDFKLCKQAFQFYLFYLYWFRNT